jgi:anti-sigma factor RsiW
MKCDEVEKRIPDYIEGLITPEEESLIRTHLESCKKCGAAYSDLIKTVEHIKDLEEIEPPPWLTQKVMTRIKEEDSKEGLWKRLFYPLQIKLPLEAAATVLVVITALYIFKATEHETKMAEVRPGNVEVQQLRRDDTLRQKGAETVEAKKKSVSGGSGKTLSSRSGPSVPSEATTAQEPGHGNLTPPISQKESTERNVPQPSPAPAHQSGSASGAVAEKPVESEATDKRRAIDNMKYAAPLQREELKQRPASTASIGKMEKTVSEENRVSRREITLPLAVANIDTAREQIAKITSGLGGRTIKTENVLGKMVLTLEIDSKNLTGFFEKLRTVGELKEKEPVSGLPEGTVKVKIEMVKTSDS